MKLREAYAKFMRKKKIEGLSKKSLQDYKNFVNLFISYLGDNKDIYTITQEDLEDYMEYQIDRKISPNTYATYVRHFKVFIHWMCDNYEVNLNYKKIQVPKIKKKQIKVYTNDEIKQIYDNLSENEGWINARNKVIVSLMLDSGLRQNEVSTLLHENIFIGAMTIKVIGKGDKERMVPLGKQTKRLYEEYRRLMPKKYRDSPYAIVGRYGEQVTNNSIKLMIAKLSKKLPFAISSHKLRHNFATNYCLDMYYQKGQMDIYKLMIIMGHEDIETTRRYMHIANEIIACTESISHLDKVFGVA